MQLIQHSTIPRVPVRTILLYSESAEASGSISRIISYTVIQSEGDSCIDYCGKVMVGQVGSQLPGLALIIRMSVCKVHDLVLHWQRDPVTYPSRLSKVVKWWVKRSWSTMLNVVIRVLAAPTHLDPAFYKKQLWGQQDPSLFHGWGRSLNRMGPVLMCHAGKPVAALLLYLDYLSLPRNKSFKTVWQLEGSLDNKAGLFQDPSCNQNYFQELADWRLTESRPDSCSE